jgi:epoxyqueuosine reductase
MHAMTETPEALKARVRRQAAALGFDACRFAAPGLPAETGERLDGWLAAGHHGTMDWMGERTGWRRSPAALWPDARTAVVVAASYAPGRNPLGDLSARTRGNISVYARRRDYHEVMRGHLKTLGQKLHAGRPGTAGSWKVYVDTAPVMEKPLAAQAGIGWQGKHTVLLSREHGNWLFLGVLLTTRAIPPDEPAREHCGTCRRCLDVCPTAAFPAPFVLDSRRCISYLTIEHAGPIPPALRPAFGNRVFGCDDCLAVCPWNRFAAEARETRLAALAGLDLPPLADLLTLDDAAFRRKFAGTPVRRAGRDRFLRNVLVAAGNSGEPALLPQVMPLLDDAAAVVRGAAVWAFRRLAAPDRAEQERQARAPAESDPTVRAEWSEALP